MGSMVTLGKETEKIIKKCDLNQSESKKLMDLAKKIGPLTDDTFGRVCAAIVLNTFPPERVAEWKDKIKNSRIPEEEKGRFGNLIRIANEITSGNRIKPEWESIVKKLRAKDSLFSESDSERIMTKP